MVENIMSGLNILKINGYDFGELTVGAVMDLDERDFQMLVSKVVDQDFPIPVFNSFVPPGLPLTGPDRDKNAIHRFLEKATERVSLLGGRQIIFGSGNARRIPEGFPKSLGMEQIVEFITMCNAYGLKHGLDIVLEPLNSRECNVLNKVEAGYQMVKDVNLPAIKLLADTYHMHQEKESFDVLEKTADVLVHVHLADAERACPGIREDGVDFAALAGVLKKMDYRGSLSFECNFASFEEECGRSLTYIKNIFR